MRASEYCRSADFFLHDNPKIHSRFDGTAEESTTALPWMPCGGDTTALPSRVLARGRSMGGYLAPRAAAHERRLAALIANEGLYDMIEQNIPPGMAKHVGFRGKTPSELARKMEQYNLRDSAKLIKCPPLVLDAEGEQFFEGRAKKLYDALQCPKTYINFKASEGAELHCQIGAQLLGNQRIFDWLDEVLM